MTPVTPPPAPKAVPVSLTSTTIAAGRLSAPDFAVLQAAGGSGRYAWSLSSGTLPSGLALDSVAGSIAGTPTASGVYQITLQVADATDASNAAHRTLTLTIGAAPVAIATVSLPPMQKGVAYAATLQATGGSGSVVWTIASGGLPNGLALNGDSGVISGTPASAHDVSMTIVATDTADKTDTASRKIAFSVTSGPVFLATAGLPTGRATIAYSTSQSASGGSGSYTWTASGLPAGLAIDGSGRISGTPTAAGNYAVTVAVADSTAPSNAASATYALAIAAPIRITSARTLPVAARGVAYRFAVQTSSGQGSLKWGLAGGSMPPGMSLNAATGVISGTCQQAGTWYFNARVKDAGTDDTLTLGLTIK